MQKITITEGKWKGFSAKGKTEPMMNKIILYI